MQNAKPKSVPLPISDVSPTIDPSVWYADGLSFECTQCGNCCSGGPGYVWLTIDDMQRMADYLKMDFDAFTLKHVRRVGNRYSLTEKFNYDCTFLTRENDATGNAGGGKIGCSIYPVRPTQCRTWPFWDDNLKSAKGWDRASHHCPGIKEAKGEKYPLSHIEQCRQHPESPH